MSADSPLGPQVASSLRYCQLERGEMEGGRKAGRGREGEQEKRGTEWCGKQWQQWERRKREERRVCQEETGRRVMENGQDKTGSVGGGMQTNALQERRWDLWCKELLMICILMLWQLPFNKACS